MNVELSAEQRAIMEDLLASGRFSSAEEALTAALRMLASIQRLGHQVQTGIEQADRGELIDHGTVFGQLRAMAAATQDTTKQ